MRQRGFTLIELIAVIAIVALLSIAATSIFSKSAFDTAAYGRQLEAALAYAQKAAVAERRTVSVAVAAGSVSFTICSANPCVASVAFALPTQGGGATLAAPAGVTVASSAASFAFAPSGGTNQAAPVTLTVSGGGTYGLTVEAGTGYVHR